jgi:hypothetical protein
MREGAGMSTGKVIRHGGLDLVSGSPESETVLATLRRGTKVEVLGEETWLKVRTRDGTVGRVLADFVELTPDALLPAAAEGATQDAAASRAAAASCEIRLYENDRFIGKELRADRDFFPCLDRLNELATDCGVEIFVTSSARDPGRTVAGAIVTPAARSNHLVGHAIDMNLKSASGFFNSKALAPAKLPSQPAEIRAFIEGVRSDPLLRWGGDFSKQDPVHIDDALNRRDPDRWDTKLASRA